MLHTLYIYNIMKKFTNYLHNVKMEFNKMKFPLKPEVISTAVGTLVIIFTTSTFFYLIDVCIKFLFKHIIMI